MLRNASNFWCKLRHRLRAKRDANGLAAHQIKRLIRFRRKHHQLVRRRFGGERCDGA